MGLMDDHQIIRRIVSGGQTGVDRGALDAALQLNIEHGGWCPRGRLAEDGVIPRVYRLTETESDTYPVRTERNVIDSDGTLILYRDRMVGGTQLTRRMAAKHRKPCCPVDLEQSPDFDEVRRWLVDADIRTLNIAGPRESSSPGIGDAARDYLVKLLNGSNSEERRSSVPNCS
jgi:hypothetical protein